MAAPTIPPEFAPVVRYRMTDNGPADIKFLNDDLLRCVGAVYIRVRDDGEIGYVGKCDGRLKDRLNAHIHGYSKPQRANFNPEYPVWANGHTITIYAYQPPQITLCGLRVRVHAGLESALIETFDPPFVKRR